MSRFFHSSSPLKTYAEQDARPEREYPPCQLGRSIEEHPYQPDPVESMLPQKAKDTLIERSIPIALTALGMLLVSSASTLAPVIVPVLLAKITTKELLPLLTLSIASNLLLGTLLYLQIASHSLTLKNGVYWDRHKSPHCPGCKSALTNASPYDGETWGMDCFACNRQIMFHDEEGKGISLDSAKKLVK